MNPEFVAISITHTVGEKLSEYFIEPFTNVGILFILVVMITNSYMFKKLRKIKSNDYIIIINMITISIYCICSAISAVLVSRLGPHGMLKTDDCDTMYMAFPRLLFIIVSIINIACFVINIVNKIKKDKEYKETIERGYFAEEQNNNNFKQTKEKSHIDLSSYVENIKENIEDLEIKDKVNKVTESVKYLVNKNKE